SACGSNRLSRAGLLDYRSVDNDILAVPQYWVGTAITGTPEQHGYSHANGVWTQHGGSPACPVYFSPPFQRHTGAVIRLTTRACQAETREPLCLIVSTRSL